MNEFTICLTDEQKKIVIDIINEEYEIVNEVSDSDIADYIKKLVLNEISSYENFF